MRETAFSKMDQITQDFSTSYWLQARIQEIRDHDVVDLYHDTLTLKELLEAILGEIK